MPRDARTATTSVAPGRLAVLADVGAIERPVAGVARPHPVVGLAAEVADPFRRRVDESYVANLHLREAEVLRSFEHRCDATTNAAWFLAISDKLLLATRDLLIACAIVEFLAQQRAGHLIGDVFDFRRHRHARSWRGRQFVADRIR